VLSARMAIRIPIQLASAVIGLVGLLICSGALFLGALGLFLVIGLGIAAWLSNRYVVAPGLLQRLSLPAAVQPLGLMVVPGIVGFVLTARGITEILMN
jgi:hypothetical protein